MHDRTAAAALALFAVLVLAGLFGTLGLWGLPALAVLGAAVLTPGGRLPAALRPRRVRALLAWAVGLLLVAIATLGEDDPLRTVCGEGGECSTRSVAEADAFFVAYLASAAAFAVWLFVRRGRDRPYASDHSSPAA